MSRDAGRVASSVDRFLTRVGLRSRIAQDSVLALGWALLGCLVVWLALGPLAAELGLPITSRQRIFVLALVTMQAMALSLRRIRPLTCLAIVALLQIALGATLPAQTMVRAGPTLVVAYTLGTCLTRRRLAALIGAAVLELVGPSVLGTWLTPELKAGLFDVTATGPAELPGAVGWALLATNLVLAYATPALLGIVVAARHTRTRLLEDRAAAASGEHEARAAMAVGAERARMARELHDIAAHHLSGMVVQAAAAERLVERDPVAARLAITTLRAEGREALSSLRSMVGVLRERGFGPDELRAPVPGLAGMSALVDHSRAMGERLDVTEDGALGPLTTIADVTAYRVLQEGLANARQHAPGQPVTVLMRQTSTVFLLRIVNALGPATGHEQAQRQGFGVLGMAERAGLAGGRLTAGEVDNGRWQVELTIPVVHEPVKRRMSRPGQTVTP